MRPAENTLTPGRRRLVVSLAAALGLALVIGCFTRYVAPAALLSLLSASAFCG
jgi:uncharacterized membrane protein YphA (DoxX/SURF4 family)